MLGVAKVTHSYSSRLPALVLNCGFRRSARRVAQGIKKKSQRCLAYVIPGVPMGSLKKCQINICKYKYKYDKYTYMSEELCYRLSS